MVFVTVFIKFFFILTPFFGLTMFLTMTNDYTEPEKKRLAIKVTLSVAIISLVMFFFGNIIFKVFGITVNAFRIGSGALLFLTAVGLVNGKPGKASQTAPMGKDEEIAVVPLALPIIVGPATIGTILIISSEAVTFQDTMVALGALLAAVVCMGLMLLLSALFERVFKAKGLIIISKITGLILAALAAQIIGTGIKGFFGV